MVNYQHGDVDIIDNPKLFKQAKIILPVKVNKEGYIKDLEAKTLGMISMKLGGGRLTKEDTIDHSAGIILNKKIGDYCNSEDILAYLYTDKEIDQELIEEFYNAYQIVDFFVENQH